MKKITSKILFVIIIILATLGGVQQCHDNNNIEELKYELEISRQNIKASTDSLRQIINIKDSTIAYAKYMQITTQNDLNNQIIELKNANKILNTKLTQYIESSIKIEHDTIYMEGQHNVQDSTLYIHFVHNDQWLRLKGTTLFNKYSTSTRIDKLTMYAPLHIGVTDDKQILITSPNPNLTITELTGITAIQKPKRKFEFNHGIQASFGLQYGLSNHSFDIGPSIGYGIELWF